MIQTPYVEQNCTVEHNGRTFEAGGAVITSEYVVGYLGDNGILNDWHGKPIGKYTITSTWKTPNSALSDCMHQVVAVVNGVRYTGRSAGKGMVYNGRRVKHQ